MASQKGISPHLKIGNDTNVILQPRDRHLLSRLADLRMADRSQLMRLGPFHSISRANSRLLALVRAGYLDRFFIGTPDNGRKAVYAISAPGAFAVSRAPRHHPRWPGQRVLRELFAEHQVLVTEVLFGLGSPPRGFSTVVTTCPDASVLEGGGLIPDGYLQIRSASETMALYVEVDLGTENISVWRKKADKYVRLALSGGSADLTGAQRFQVVVISTSTRRQEAIRRAVRSVTSKLFWFAPIEIIKSGHQWSTVWLRPTGDEAVRLLKE